MLTQPESPRWLVEVGRTDDARASLERLNYGSRIPGSAAEEAIVNTLREIIVDKESRYTLSMWGQAKAACKDRVTFYRVFIAVIVMFFQQWTVRSLSPLLKSCF